MAIRASLRVSPPLLCLSHRLSLAVTQTHAHTQMRVTDCQRDGEREREGMRERLISIPVWLDRAHPLNDRTVEFYTEKRRRGRGESRFLFGLGNEMNCQTRSSVSLRLSDLFGLRAKSPSQAFKARLGFIQHC